MDLVFVLYYYNLLVSNMKPKTDVLAIIKCSKESVQMWHKFTSCIQKQQRTLLHICIYYELLVAVIVAVLIYSNSQVNNMLYRYVKGAM